MRMIRHVLYGLLLVASSAVVAGAGALSLKVTALEPTVKSGSAVMIEVTTTNESNQTITYHNTNRCDYSVRVLTDTGAPAPETTFKKQLNKVMDCSGSGLRVTGRDIMVTLKPGESDSERILITELYNMSAPGEYSVQVDRTFGGVGHFRSNSVSVKVTE